MTDDGVSKIVAIYFMLFSRLSASVWDLKSGSNNYFEGWTGIWQDYLKTIGQNFCQPGMDLFEADFRERCSLLLPNINEAFSRHKPPFFIAKKHLAKDSFS